MARGKKEKARPKGIFKRGNVYWVCYKNLEGRVIRESSKSTNPKVAEDLLIDRRKEIKDGQEPEIKRIPPHSFQELSAEYVNWAERQRSFSQKVYVVNQLAREFGYYRLRNITTKLLEQYQTKLMQEGKKAATINRHLATIKHMMTKAVDWLMVEEEALKRVRKVKLLEENNRRLRYLSKEEIESLLNYCPSHLKPLIIMALNTGMRRGEIFNLKWEQVDLKHGFVLLDVTKNGDRREIPINRTLRETLETLHQGTKEWPRRLDIPWVFYDVRSEKPYRDLRKGFYLACKKAGIQNFKFHDCRHTFASHLVMGGVDLTSVKELLGHKTLTMTLRYSHLAPSHKVKAVEILDSIINEKPTSQSTSQFGSQLGGNG